MKFYDEWSNDEVLLHPKTFACRLLTATSDVCLIKIPRRVGQAAASDKPSDKMCKVVYLPRRRAALTEAAALLGAVCVCAASDATATPRWLFSVVQQGK